MAWCRRQWGTGSRNGEKTTPNPWTRRRALSRRRRTGGCAPSCERPGWRSSSEKSGFLLRAGVPVTARYAFIHREEGSYPITMMCRCLKVSRSGCYAWLGREPSRTVRRRKELSALVEWVLNGSCATLRVPKGPRRRGPQRLLRHPPGGGAYPPVRERGPSGRGHA